MIDWKDRQQRQAEYERRPFIEKATMEQFRARTSQYPAGSVFLWALEAVYGPPEDKRKTA